MLTFSDNPPALSPLLDDISDAADPWWVGHTKARFEKAFAADLLGQNIAYFLPMLERSRVSGGRRRRVMLPLFPSYVFFAGGVEARYRAVATGRLCQAIAVADQARLRAELATVQRALKGKAPLDPYPHAAVGRRCRVTGGPFRGLEGTVVRWDGRTRIVLEVGILGRGAAMEIDADLLEPADDRAAVNGAREIRSAVRAAV
jgi:transcription antitermination factor NusG